MLSFVFNSLRRLIQFGRKMKEIKMERNAKKIMEMVLQHLHLKVLGNILQLFTIFNVLLKKKKKNRNYDVWIAGKISIL